MMEARLKGHPSCWQRGATVVEFAFIAGLFLVLVFGIMEIGRWFFTMNSAAEATRRGARIAVVCDLEDAEIKTRMLPFLPYGTTSNILVEYAPSGCVAQASSCPSSGSCNVCTHVAVRLTDYRMPLVIPWFGASAPIPAFRTMLPRESMLSQVEGRDNPRCQ